MHRKPLVRQQLFRTGLAVLTFLVSPLASSQGLGGNPFSEPINRESQTITVNYEEFARIPDHQGQAPRLMHMITEPGSRRHFVSTMPGKLYAIDYSGDTVNEYLDLTDYGVEVMAAGRERGLQSFDFHPQFTQAGAPGYGKFYTYTDVLRGPEADFSAGGNRHSHDTVLLEWSAADSEAGSYDGEAPRELLRVAQPFANHNGGEIAFNPLATPDSSDFGLLYAGLADGGSGGDPLGTGQDLGNLFGKILRIDPLASDSTNGSYGIPAANPFVDQAGALPEIYAYGVRNPQRFGWDPANGRMLVADIGQNQVEEISPVPAGGNLGWNEWEGSYRYENRQIRLDDPRSAPGLTWPLVEYDHNDPMLIGRASITGVHVFRNGDIPGLTDSIVFADIPSGELLYVPADTSGGGQEAIRRVLLNDAGEGRTLMALIRDNSDAQRADLRFGAGPDNELFLLNKADGIIRKIIP